jgi:branched-chain amino acid transport system ATP-binding protein
MLAIARALMGRPTLLLLDEPSLGLAPKLVAELMATLAALHRDGLTLLLVEQNATAALAIADRAVVLETGRVRLQGSAAELRDAPELQALYLGG